MNIKTFFKKCSLAIVLLTVLSFALPAAASARLVELHQRDKYAEATVKDTAAATDGTDPVVRIIAVGDNLIHKKLIAEGLQEDGTRNYDALYSMIAPYIEGADVKIINQETMLVKNESDYSGYPTFGTPWGVGEAAIKAGFNVFTLATNHSYDKQERGVKNTVEFFKKHPEVLSTGIYGSQEAYNTITYGEYNGIKIAFLNYTYGINEDLSTLKEKYYIKFLQSKLIKKEVSAAAKVADFVIVLPHWGEEYQYEENEEQQEFAQMMADAGADLIIGTHPHVVQPLKIITASDGREVPCYYSVGNFISNMYNFSSTLEAMADVTITKTSEGVKILRYEIKPLVNHIDNTGLKHTVYPLSVYTAELADDRPARSHFYEKGSTTVKKLWEQFTKVTGYDKDGNKAK